MKHSSKNLLPNIKKTVEKNKKTVLFLESWSSLPLVINSLKKPCSIVCDEGLFDDISSSFDLLSSNIAFIPSVDKDESLSSSYHQEMFERASALRAIELTEPRSVIGKSTVESLQSGAVYGFASQIDGMVERFKQELGDCTVIATGGLAHLIAPVSKSIDHVEPFLTLHGLRLVYDLNRENDG